MGVRARVLIALVVTVLAAGAFAPTASASDQSVYDAWVSRDADFEREGREFRSARRAWSRSGYRRTRGVLREISDAQKLLRAVDETIEAEEPTTENGARGKQLALRADAQLHTALAYLRRAVIALKRGNKRRAARLAGISDRYLERTDRSTRAARSAFKAAGVQIKPAG